MNRFLALVICVIFITACETETLVTFDSDQNLILKNIHFEPITSSTCVGRFADFDRSGKLTQVYWNCSGQTQVVRDYTYTSNGLISGFTDYYDFIYDQNDRLL